jgi:hypothetical protein
MKNGEEMVDCSVLGVRKIKSVEQWCFSIGKNDEKLLAMVFQQRRKVKSVERWCFSIGKVKSAERWCFSIERKSTVLKSGVSASGKLVSLK